MLALAASTALITHPALADNLPTGASVAAGQVSIDTSQTTMTITQGSNRAIVNWNGFSVGAGNTVRFLQPDTSSAILNRVTGSATSSIAGTITGNGQVYLVNPNGIAITSTGTVKVGGGFVASTLDLSDEDFARGNLTFNGNGASARVSNEGVITIGRGGYAALIGGTVRNDGLIAVPMGKAGLGSGEQATLDLSGDGFLQVALPTKAGQEGEGALVENGGTISADGGMVVMKAATAREAARQAINLSGVVEAKTISGKNGAIVIGGGDGGSVRVSGKVKATAASGKGGAIAVTGRDVALKGAEIDASGANGGGTVKIGGDWQGKAGTQRAQTTTIDEGSVIRADATQAGDGGTVVVWSDTLTQFGGLITARGAGYGAGGNAEVSGKARLAYQGYADLSAESGVFGNLLLDPYNVTISNAANSNNLGFTASGPDSVINVAILQAALAGANVTVSTGTGGSQTGDITVADAITWSSGSRLTLSAYRNIAVNADITGGSGASVVLRADNTGTGTGTVSFANGKRVTASGGLSVFYNAASYAAPTNYAAYAASGTPLTAYMLVNNVENLQAIGTNLGGRYALGRDIDASVTASWNSGAGFVPLGYGLSWTTAFSGWFDGQGHTITGLTINRPGTVYVALFGSNNGTITNVGLVGSNVTGGTSAGGLVGVNNEYGTITHSYASGTVTGSDYNGGLVGANNGTITQSYATGTVKGWNLIGGLVGTNGGTITQSYASGTVTGLANTIGGLVGSNGGTITQSYATGAVNAAGSYAGGLVGLNYGTISHSYASGAVSGASTVGGLAGNSLGGITSSYWDTQKSGRSIGIAGGVTAGAIGLTTAGMADPFVFIDAGWDFTSVWATPKSGGAPVLRSVTTLDIHDYYVRLSGNVTTIYGTIGSTSGITATGIGANNVGIDWNSSISAAISAGTYSYNGADALSLTYAPGTSATDYYIAYGTVGLTVNKAALTISANAASKTYDGLAYTGGNGVIYSGFVDGETAAVLGGTLAYGGTAQGAVNAGSYAISASGYSSQNYAITYVAAGMTITPAALTVTAGNASKTYDGLAYTGGNGVTYSGLVNGETAAVLGGTLAYGGTAQGAVNAGSYAVSASGLTSQNYAITYVDGGLTVNKAALTVTADNASKTYDGLAYTGGNGVTYSGLVNDETAAVLGGTLAYGGTAQGAVNAGSYAISASGLTSANYAITYVDGSLTVNKAALTVTADNASKTYDGLAYAGGNGVTYSGLVDGETAAVLGGTLTYGGTAQGAVNAGSYAISASGYASQNYTITYVGNTLTITPAALTVTADSESRSYGAANPAFTYQITSGTLFNGDELTGALATGASVTSGVGTYGITQGTLDNANYAITYVGNTLTITPAALTVMADSAARSYGAANPSFTYHIINGNLFNGDELTGALSTSAAATSGVGTYGITQGTLDNANYAITYVGNTLTITPAALTVTANSASRSYGAANPAFTYQITSGSLFNGDALTGALATGASVTSGVGTYGITQGTLDNANYAITYVGNTLTITPAALTVRANSVSKIYDGLAWSGSNGVTYSGFVNGETAAVLGGTLAYGGTAQGAVNAGNYAISASGLTSANYAITYVDGSLTVRAVSPAITTGILLGGIVLAPQTSDPAWSSIVSYTAPGAGATPPDVLMVVEDAALGSNPACLALGIACGNSQRATQ